MSELGEHIRILIVHSSPHQTEDVAPLLDAARFATRVVSDGGSALGVLEVWRPEIAIVDLRRHSSEGRQFCLDVAARPDRGQVAVVLLSDGPNLLKRYGVVPDGLLPAPVDPQRLDTVLADVSRALAARTARQIV